MLSVAYYDLVAFLFAFAISVFSNMGIMCNILGVDLIETNLVMQACAGLGRLCFTGLSAVWPIALRDHEETLMIFPNPSLLIQFVSIIAYVVIAIFFLAAAYEPENLPSKTSTVAIYGVFGFFFSSTLLGLGPLTQYITMSPGSTTQLLAVFGGSAGSAGFDLQPCGTLFDR